jgi:hypothetical protein
MGPFKALQVFCFESVWNKLPLTDQQRQDLLKALIEENDHMPKSEENMTKFAQNDEPDLIKICPNDLLWSNNAKT